MDLESDTRQQFKVPWENPQEAKGDVIAEGDDEKLLKILFLIKFLADEKFLSQALRDRNINWIKNMSDLIKVNRTELHFKIKLKSQ